MNDTRIDIKQLPVNGLSRWSVLKNFIPFSKEKFRQLQMQGKAPQPIRMGIRCTFYKNEEIHQFLNNPLDYKVKGDPK